MNTPDRAQPPDRRVYSVSALNREVRVHLEGGFASVWVEGEISNLYRARSGHSYFVLKDDVAQVKCAFFRQRNPYGSVRIDDGQQALVRGRLSLYEPRGEYQLIVDHVEDAGEGRLRREFERLKQQLAAEGLFAPDRKRPLPRFPRTIAVLTSPDGAAIRDVISVISRRYPAVRLVIVPSRVQGAGAEAELLAGFARAVALGPDAILVTRGGGSLEDLWAFNDERLARAIAASPIPTVCAVGHETDVSIAEFAADVRAATPSAAAELMVPDGDALRQRLVRAARALDRHDPRRTAERHTQRIDELGRRLAGALRSALARHGERADGLTTRLRAVHPARRLQATTERCQALEGTLRRRLGDALAGHARSTALARQRLLRAAPDTAVLGRRADEVRSLHKRLARAVRADLHDAGVELAAAGRRLVALSPQAVLERGYSVTRVAGTGRVVREPAEVVPDEEIVTRVAGGEFRSRVAGSEETGGD